MMKQDLLFLDSHTNTYTIIKHLAFLLSSSFTSLFFGVCNTCGMAGRCDKEHGSIEHKGERHGQRMDKGGRDKFKDSKEFASLLELSKLMFVDEIMTSESSAPGGREKYCKKPMGQEDVAKISCWTQRKFLALMRLNWRDMIGKKNEVERINK
jgi:hypothetical protein